MEAAASSSENAISPVKRLITMYNSNGATAHKASRRKRKSNTEIFDDERINLVDNGASNNRKRESLSSPESFTSSRESSPRNGNDDDNCWSSDECSVEKPENQSPTVSLSPTKPSDVFRDSSDSDKISWEIAVFNLKDAIYESSRFTHVDQSWNLSFGHNNADGYGYILCLHEPKIESLHLQCSFNMHLQCGPTYTKAREEAYIFGTKSMNSRGFVNFASNNTVQSHIQTNGVLRLSVVMKVVLELPFYGSPKSTPLSHAIGELFEGCYKQDEAKDLNTRRRNASETQISGNFAGSLLREADFQNEFLVRASTNGSNESEYESGISHDTGTGNDSYSVSSQSITPTTRLLCPISFQPFIAFKGLYCTSSDDRDTCIIVEGPPRSPTGLIASPYIPALHDSEVLNSHAISDRFQDTTVHSLNHENDSNSGNSSTNQAGFSNFDYYATQESKIPEGKSNDSFFIAKQSSVHRGVCLESLGDDEQVNTTCEGSTTCQYHIDPERSPTASRSPNSHSNYDSRVCKMDQLGSLFLPCMKNDSHDLLADSLRTIAHQSRVDDACGPLSKSSRSPYMNPRAVSLVLPFTDSLKAFESIDQVRQPLVLKDENLHQPNYTYDHNGPSLPEMEIQSNYNTDAEISPMSPAPVTALKKHHCMVMNGNNIDLDIIPTRIGRDFSAAPVITSGPSIDLNKCVDQERSQASPDQDLRTKCLVPPTNNNETCNTKTKLTISGASVILPRFCGDHEFGRPSGLRRKTRRTHSNSRYNRDPEDSSREKSANTKFKKKSQGRKYLIQSVAISLMGVLLSHVPLGKFVMISILTKHVITIALKFIAVLILLATTLVIEKALADGKKSKQ